MTLPQLQSKIAQSEGILLYFWGDNCNVCEALRPKIKEAFDENFPKIEQIYLNAKENIEIAAHYSVFSIPTMMVFLDGKEFTKASRNISIEQLITQVDRPYSMMFGEDL
ncbi:MAG: thioredoxin family protein [Campylobacterales bacterium]|nr:thioredoxin family protein [Campylobacterales bacterium]